MNLMHLKYAVEVERTRSISKAAQALYMGQPNLSRAIKELEESLGITIFDRTSKGITPTAQGERFLAYAKSILSQIEEVESIYKRERENKLKFSVCAVRDGYAAKAFAEIAGELPDSMALELDYRETDASSAVECAAKGGCNLAVVRYETANEKYFDVMLAEKRLVSQELWQFDNLVLMSHDHPLANEERITSKLLSNHIEVVYNDFVYAPATAQLQKQSGGDNGRRRIAVNDRAGAFDLLSSNLSAFMRSSPQPPSLIKRCGLTQRRCDEGSISYKDVIISKSGYKLTEIDEKFISALKEACAEAAAVPAV